MNLKSFKETRVSTKLQLLLLSLFILIPTLLIDAQELDSAYVVALKGLRVRDAPGLYGKPIDLMPYGTDVYCIEESGEEITISGATGRWTKIAYQGGEGWTFGGYLLKTSIEGIALLDQMEFGMSIETLKRYLPLKFDSSKESWYFKSKVNGVTIRYYLRENWFEEGPYKLMFFFIDSEMLEERVFYNLMLTILKEYLKLYPDLKSDLYINLNNKVYSFDSPEFSNLLNGSYQKGRIDDLLIIGHTKLNKLEVVHFNFQKGKPEFSSIYFGPVP